MTYLILNDFLGISLAIFWILSSVSLSFPLVSKKWKVTCFIIIFWLDFKVRGYSEQLRKISHHVKWYNIWKDTSSAWKYKSHKILCETGCFTDDRTEGVCMRAKFGNDTLLCFWHGTINNALPTSVGLYVPYCLRVFNFSINCWRSSTVSSQWR